MKIESHTIKNNKFEDKPNEDVIRINETDEFVDIVLLDGVSRDRENGVYPNPSPATIITELFADNCINVMKNENIDNWSLDILKRIIETSNEQMKGYNVQHNLGFPAGCVGIILRVIRGKIYYAYIGDCTGVFLTNEEVKYFTFKQTEEVVKHKKELTTKQIRYEICNNINHPYGYGVWDGNPGAMDFVKYGEFDYKDGDVLLLFTDGAEEALYCQEYEAWKSTEIDRLIYIKEQEENKAIIYDDQAIIRVVF